MQASKSRLPLWQRKDFDTLCTVPSFPSPALGRADQWLTGAVCKYRLAFQCHAVTFRVGTQSCLWQFCPNYFIEISLPGNLRWFLLYPRSLSGTAQDPPCKTAVASWLFCNNKCGLWLTSLNSSAKRTSAKTGNKRHHLYLQPLWCFLARRSTV